MEEMFEQKLNKLEGIITALEGGQTSLSEMMELYEQGVKLYRECGAQLEDFDKRLNEQASGDK